MSRGKVTVYHDDSVDNDEKRLHSNFYKGLQVRLRLKPFFVSHFYIAHCTRIILKENKLLFLTITFDNF